MASAIHSTKQQKQNPPMPAPKAQAQMPQKQKLTLHDFKMRARTNQAMYSGYYYQQLLIQLSMSFDLSDLPVDVIAELYASPPVSRSQPQASFADLLQALHNYLLKPRTRDNLTILAYFLAPFLPAFGKTIQAGINSIVNQPTSAAGTPIAASQLSLQVLQLMVETGFALSVAN